MRRKPRRRRRRGRRPVRAVLRIVAAAVVVWLVATAGAVVTLRFVDPPVSAFMWLEPGPVDALRFAWVDRARISIEAVRAVIAAEDQKFLVHHGFDIEQIDRALDAYRAGGELRGASTITQQVAKNLFLWPGRNFARKGLEAYFAVLIELAWPKERILEIYLNVAEFGQGVFGVGAAAEELLGTRADALTRAEAARLAAVLPSPKRLRVEAPSDYVRTRATEIERQMQLLEERGHYRALAW